MKEVLEIMNKRAVALKKAIDKAKRDSGPYPEGHLRISSGNNRVRYFRTTLPGDCTGEYIKKENRTLVTKLAQKDYNHQFIEDAEMELKKLEHAIAWFSKHNADLTYLDMSSHRKKLVTPYMTTDELYAKAWQNQPVKTSTYMTEKLVYETKRGEMVRSKSEAIIANIIYDLGIPYFYEKSITLKNGCMKSPDFTLLHVKRRTEIYLEHFGLLDDESYLYKNLQKLDEYRENGIYPGKNLLFTYETAENPIDIRGIREMLRGVFELQAPFLDAFRLS